MSKISQLPAHPHSHPPCWPGSLQIARFLKLLALIGSAVAIVMSPRYLAAEKQQRFEYSILILLSTTGMMMLISAADLIALRPQKGQAASAANLRALLAGSEIVASHRYGDDRVQEALDHVRSLLGCAG